MFCTRCGSNNLDSDQFCRSCGAQLVKSGAEYGHRSSSGSGQVPYPNPPSGSGRQHSPQSSSPYPGYQGFSPQSGPSNYPMASQDWRVLGADKKILAGILGILVGGLGIHKFILGYKTEGLIMLLGTLLTCGVAGIVFGPVGLVEGILYLVKSDEEFVKTYVQNKRGWF